MAIAVGTADQNFNSNQTTVSTPSITVSGSNTIGIAWVADNVFLNTDTCTWNGQAMTAITSQTDTLNGYKIWMFYIVAPTTGAVTATRGIGTNNFWIHAIYYTGASQTGQPDSFASSGLVAGTTFTQSTTVVASNCWMVCGTLADGGGLAASTGSTLRGSIQGTATGIFDSNGTVSTGSQSMIQTMSNGLRTGIIASIVPAATSNIKSLNTVTYANIKSVNGVAIASVKSINGIT